MSMGDPVNPLSLLGIASGVPDMWAHINKDEMNAQLIRDLQNVNMNAQAAQAQQAGIVHKFPPLPTPPAPPLPPSLSQLGSRAREMFLKRMGGLRAEMKVAADDFLACHIYNEQVYVFYCFGGRHGVTMEGIDLFPSDQLITQFRLVLT
jgi:hypothetical protein